MTLSQSWQQSELEFHDVKPKDGSSEEVLEALMKEDLNWRRDCF